MANSRIQYLVERYFQNECTLEEKVELLKWIEEPSHDEELKIILEEKWIDFEPRHVISPDRAGEILASILKDTSSDSVERNAVVRRISWWKISVAASIILFLGAGIFFLFNNRQDRTMAGKTISAGNKAIWVENDVNPGKTKAVLTLADGSQVVLDNSPDGVLAVQGVAKVINQKGELRYDEGAGNSNEVLYNTLTTHRGEHFPLKLADGTKIWLNSESSIHYPVTFSTDERKVEITGEAYFEVAKNAEKPFKVLLNGMEIMVLGTHFNVNGYADEANIETTLLEGSVKVSKSGEVLHLVPGQQARLTPQGKIDLIKDVDIEAAVSWKDGYFHFNRADLEMVMRNLSRWYDVDVIYEPGSKKRNQFFSGDIERTLTLSAVLRVLERSEVNFRIEGKKLIVMP